MTCFGRGSRLRANRTLATISTSDLDDPLVPATAGVRTAIHHTATLQKKFACRQRLTMARTSEDRLRRPLLHFAKSGSLRVCQPHLAMCVGCLPCVCTKNILRKMFLCCDLHVVLPSSYLQLYTFFSTSSHDDMTLLQTTIKAQTQKRFVH